ncbi:MAG: TlpA disulfide reductase family protein [Pseudonocardiales bacterium]
MTNSHPSAAGRRPSKLTKQQRAAAASKAAIRRQRRAAAVAVVIAVAAAILVTVGVVAFRGHSSPSSSNTTPTAFSLPALNGSGRVTLTQFRGKPTVVNFFASWCSACDSELPGFKAEADALKGRVNFVGVDSLETGDKNYMPRRHHLLGSFAALAQDVGGSNGSGLHDALGGGNTMPLTAFYDSNGKLLDVERTALVPASVLTDKINQLYHLTST